MTTTESRNDANLKTAITDELSWLPNLNSTHIGVAVNDGAITLSGEVSSYPEKILAEKTVLHVRGVTAVAEEITVNTGWQALTDTDIAREASEAIDRAIDIPAGSVKAAVTDHVITLSGDLPWQYQRAAAGRAVRYLKGVKNVHNLITLKPTASAVGIKSAIIAALMRTAQIDGQQTTVLADQAGFVTLQGTVHTYAERVAAQRAAWSAPGVTGVRNEIRVQA